MDEIERVVHKKPGPVPNSQKKIFQPLTSRDKKILMTLWTNNFDYPKTFDELFPDRKGVTKEYKSQYFSMFFRDRRKYATEYIDSLIKEEFKKSFITKEQISLKLWKIAEKHEKIGKVADDKLAAGIYQFIAKMLGYVWDKVEIEKIQPVKIEYVLPEHANPVEFKIIEPSNIEDVIQIEIKKDDVVSDI
jgi:hypothetical protein